MYEAVTEDILALTRELIEAHHESLYEARIAVIFKDKASVSKGMVTYGQAKKVSEDVQAAGLPFDFIIILAKDHWFLLEEYQQRALVDHELCHCRAYEDGSCEIMPHQIEEFYCIFERHGFWRPDSQKLIDAIQPHLIQIDKIRGVVGTLTPGLMANIPQ